MLRRAVWTNQNNFAQLLFRQRTCCRARCNFSTQVPSQPTTCTYINSRSNVSSAFNIGNTLRASCVSIAYFQFFDPLGSPGPSAASAVGPAVIKVFIFRFGQSFFMCPYSPHA